MQVKSVYICNKTETVVFYSGDCSFYRFPDAASGSSESLKKLKTGSSRRDGSRFLFIYSELRGGKCGPEIFHKGLMHFHESFTSVSLDGKLDCPDEQDANEHSGFSSEAETEACN